MGTRDKLHFYGDIGISYDLLVIGILRSIGDSIVIGNNWDILLVDAGPFGDCNMAATMVTFSNKKKRT